MFKLVQNKISNNMQTAEETDFFYFSEIFVY